MSLFNLFINASKNHNNDITPVTKYTYIYIHTAMALPKEQVDKSEAPSWRFKRQADMKESPYQRQEQEAPLLHIHPFLLRAMTVRV